MRIFEKIKNKKLKKESIKRQTLFISGLLFGIIPFLFIIYLLIGPLIKVIKKDFSSETMITISENLRIRSDKDKNAYVIGSYPFGTKVEVYQVFDNNWAEVSIGNKKGYMSFEYLVLPETFYIIEGMFGNDNAKKLIASTKYRIAISNYLKSNNYTTKISKSEREKLYGKNSKKEMWQIFAEPPKAEFNSFCYGDYNGDSQRDAAFILTNIKSGKRKLIVLEVNNDIAGRYGNLIGTKDLNEDYVYIKNIPKRTKMIVRDSLQRIDVDAVLLGVNRSKSFNDTDTLMIYNGRDFDYFPQIIKDN
ncbi:MAG: SH3 domain-containing protein [Bacteroidales bacterium]|nr:SH3 domain-containing protein [Bacteroidales bacterium]